MFFKRNGSLFFSIVDDSHAGKYTCTPFNVLGTEGQVLKNSKRKCMTNQQFNIITNLFSPSSIIRVFVQHPPEFILKPKSVYMQKLNDTLTIYCTAQDKHTDTDRTEITWTRKEGIPLPFKRHSLAGGNLTIHNITAGLQHISYIFKLSQLKIFQMIGEFMFAVLLTKQPQFKLMPN